MEKIKKFLKDEEGAAVIEYGLIAACVAMAIFAVVFAPGTQPNN